MKESNAKVGADDVGVFADEGRTVVRVELVRNTTTEDGLLEGVVKALRAFVQVVGRVGDESTVVIDEDGEVGGDGLALRGGELGTGAEVGHPEVVGERCFEGFAWAVEGIELGATLAMETTISEEPVDGGERRQVGDLVVIDPTPVGDFDGDLWVSFALFDEPVLLFVGKTAFLDEALHGFCESVEATLLIGIPPVFEGADGKACACGVGPWARGSIPDRFCQGETIALLLLDVTNSAVTDERALFLWCDLVMIGHAGDLSPRRH